MHEITDFTAGLIPNAAWARFRNTAAQNMNGLRVDPQGFLDTRDGHTLIYDTDQVDDVFIYKNIIIAVIDSKLKWGRLQYIPPSDITPLTRTYTDTTGAVSDTIQFKLLSSGPFTGIIIGFTASDAQASINALTALGSGDTLRFDSDDQADVTIKLSRDNAVVDWSGDPSYGRFIYIASQDYTLSGTFVLDTAYRLETGEQVRFNDFNPVINLNATKDWNFTAIKNATGEYIFMGNGTGELTGGLGGVYVIYLKDVFKAENPANPTASHFYLNTPTIGSVSILAPGHTDNHLENRPIAFRVQAVQENDDGIAVAVSEPSAPIIQSGFKTLKADSSASDIDDNDGQTEIRTRYRVSFNLPSRGDCEQNLCLPR